MFRFIKHIIKLFLLKKNEKILLKELKEHSKDSELLSNVKKGVDPLGKLRGDFRFKAEIYLRVRTVFTAGGAVIAPAALPANLQTQVPIYLFSLTDFQGGFTRSQTLYPYQNWAVLNILVSWLNNPPIVELGDLMIIYQNGIHLCYVSIHCNNVGYGTFLHSFASDLIILNSIRYTVPILQLQQLLNPLNFGVQSLFGKLVTDTIDPRLYITNQTFNPNISDIPVTLPIDKNLLMSTYLDYDVQELGFLLTVQKVKPLTLR